MRPMLRSNAVMLLPFFSRFYYGWTMVGSALVINIVGTSMNPVVFSFFLGPMSDDLGVGKSALSWALTIRLITAGVTAPMLGMLLDRYGARWLGVASGLVAGCMLIALAGVRELWLIYVMFGISGMVGIGGPAGSLLTQVPLAKWFVAHRGRAMAIATIGLPGGTVLAIPLVQWLIHSFGWRPAWVTLGIAIAVVIPLVSILFVRRSPEDMGLAPDGAAVQVDGVGVAPAVVEVNWTVGEALRTPALWIVLTAMGVIGMALTGTLVSQVAFWEDIGMVPGVVALGVAFDPFTVIFSSFLFGTLGDRIAVRYLGAIAGGGLALSMLTMVFPTTHAYSIFVHSFVWGAAAGAFITVNNLVWPKYYGRRFLGTIRGIVLPVSVAAAGLGAPGYGYLFDAGVNHEIVWSMSLVLFALGGVLLLIARPPRTPRPITAA
ncbi:MAG: MFS transporter [Dehalococcoidia bacterium]|nr:MFS transporter [Dehalococcoidia bacterium]